MPGTLAKSKTNRRNTRYEKRAGSILKAASKVMAEDGFEGASVRKVAARAGITLSGIYYYFKSKDEMLYALQENTFSTLLNSLKNRLNSVESPRARLRAVIENHFRLFASNMDDLKVCVHEIGSLSGAYFRKILRIRREYYRLVRDVVIENLGKKNRRDANLITLYLFGSLNWIYMWYDPKKNADIDKLTDRLLKIFLEGMKAT